jgi:hypothetical protein
MATIGRSFQDLVKGGGHNYVGVYHVAGMDWAAVTDRRLQDAFDAYTAANVAKYKRLLFGSVGTASDGETLYNASDHVQMLEILDQEFGTQSIKYGEKKGIDIGSWSVKISRDTAGYVYENGPQTGWGLPGLDWIIDVEQDATVSRGVLAANFDGATLRWYNDEGLATRVNGLASGERLLLYIGSRCVLVVGGVHSAVYDSTNAWWYINNTGSEGALDTPDQRVYASTEDVQERIRIHDIPHFESVVGLFGYLFLVPINDDGSIEGFDNTSGNHDRPILFRYGQIATNPSGTPGDWKISHNGITKSMQATVPIKKFEAKLSGFQFSRELVIPPFVTTSHIPHIRCIEVSNNGGTVKQASIYLTTAGGYVRYETHAELLAAIRDALNASSTLDFSYSIDDSGTDIIAAAGAQNNQVIVYGCAAFAAGIGYVNPLFFVPHIADAKSGYTGHAMWPERAQLDGVLGQAIDELPGSCPYFYLKTKEGIAANRKVIQWTVINTAGTLTAVKNFEIPGMRSASRCKYFLSWDRNFTYDHLGGWQPTDKVPYWRVPEDGSSNKRIYLSPESNATDLESGYKITLGSSDNQTTDPILPTINRSLVLSGSVAATPTDRGYFVPDTGGYGSPALFQPEVKIGNTVRRGLPLYHAPLIQKEDPWKITDSVEVAGNEPSKLFRALLGDAGALLPVPSRMQVTTIPHVKKSDPAYKFFRWEDWEELDNTGDSAYALSLKADKFKILDAMSSFAFTHGKRMTYGYDETERTWVLGLTDIKSVSTAQVTASGRVIDSTDIIPMEPTDVIGQGWLYAGVEVEAQKELDSKIKVQANKTIGRTAHITESKILKIKDSVSLFPDESEGVPNLNLLNTVKDYARLFAVPVTQHRVNCVTTALTSFVVGEGTSITWAALHDETEGRRTGETKVGEVVDANISLNRITLLIRIGRQQPGISSSLFVDNVNIDSVVSTTVSIGSGTALPTDPANNDFANTNGGLTDLATFGCIDYDDITGELKQRDTTCGPFRIWIFERDTDDLIDTGSTRNVWSGELRGTGTSNELLVADVQAGTCTIELDDATNFSTVEASGSNFVVIFADRDDSNLCACQLNYGWYGDANGLVQDSTAANHRAISWG